LEEASELERRFCLSLRPNRPFEHLDFVRIVTFAALSSLVLSSSLRFIIIIVYSPLISSTFFTSFTDSKTFSKPRRPFEKVRLDAELKTVGEFGLRNKRELWRVQFALNKLRNAARVLLTLDENDPKRIFEGNAILKRMRTYGLLEADKESLDYVLALNAEEFLERRLQTLVFKLGLAKSVHHARILIKQRHIRVGKQIVNVPSFLVRVETQKHIDFALNSPLGGGRPGRVKRRRMAQKAAAAGGGDDEEEEEE